MRVLYQVRMDGLGDSLNYRIPFPGVECFVCPA